MPPKRQQQRLSAAQAAAALAEAQGQPPADTLVSASGSNVEQLLQRAAKRRAKAAGAAGAALPSAVAAAAGLVPGLPAARRQAAVGACGAAAVVQRDAPDQQEAEEAAGHAEQHGSAAAAAAAAAAGQAGDVPGSRGQNPATDDRQHGSLYEEEEEEDEEEWEDAWEEGKERAAGAGGASASGAAEGSDGEGQEGGGINLTFDRKELLGGTARRRPKNGGAGGAAAVRRGVSKADRFEARLVHRTALLCQLARGLLHDAAADDPLLQSLLLSMVPQDRLLKLDAGGGTAGGIGTAVSTQGLHQQLSWFRETFALPREPPSCGCGSSGTGQEDLLVAAFRGSKGLDSLVAELVAAVQEAAAAKRERSRVVVRSAEHYCTLFAALLRAQGAAVRLVCALTPGSLKPTEAARQRCAAMDAFRRQFGAAAAAYSGCDRTDRSVLAAAAVAEVAKQAQVDASDRRAADAAVVHFAAQGRLPSPLLAGSEREALAAAVPAAKALLSGLEAGRVHAVKQAVQRQHRLADVSCVFRVGAEGAAHLELPLAYELSPLESAFAVDHAKSWQQKKKQRKAAEEAAAAEEDGGLALAFAPAKSSGRGRGGGGSSGAGAGGVGRGRGKQHALQREMSAAASAAQVSAAAAVSAAAVSEATAASAKGQGRKSRARAAAKPAAAAAAASQASSDVEIVEDDDSDEGPAQSQRPQQGAQPPAGGEQQQAGAAGLQRQRRQKQAAAQSKRKRKGDLDEEAALAQALQASLADAGGTTGTADSSALAAAAAGGGGGSQAKAPAKRTPMRGSKGSNAGAADATPPKQAAAAADTGAGTAVAAQRCARGLCWVEVFCRELDEDGAETGVCRWHHADPATAKVDRARQVEGDIPKDCQPLAYVVALAGGGAKDVTQRYTSSWLAAEQARDGDWWTQTLGPLRQREEAAARRAAGAAGPSSASAAQAAQAEAAAGKAPPAAAPAGKGGRKRRGAKGAAAAEAGKQEQEEGGQDPGGTSAAAAAAAAAAASAAAAAAAAASHEDAELQQRERQEAVSKPSTVAAFKTHPTFVLDRHIGKYQAIVPWAKKAGMHKQEPYWYRKDLADLHTNEQWRREGHQVKPEELPNPAKRVKKRRWGGKGGRGGRGGRGGGGDEGLTLDWDPDAEEGPEDLADGELQDPAAFSSFYGPWQTVEYEPPAAEDGIVPKNERGNVEVPPLNKLMPRGTVHINLPGAALICRRLKIDYAPALSGFTIRGGQNVPDIEGVVVCTEFEQTVRAAYEEDQKNKQEKERRKKDEEAEDAWRKLLRAVLAKVQVRRAYGADGEAPPAGAGAMADAAAALLGDSAAAAAATMGGKRRGGSKRAGAATDELTGQQQQPKKKAKVAKQGNDGVIDLADSDSDGAQQQQEQRQQQQPAAAAAAARADEHLADVETEEI
ncbi:hypothetical protein ABPG75_013187 [Micractinium tetrahymenae]